MVIPTTSQYQNIANVMITSDVGHAGLVPGNVEISGNLTPSNNVPVIDNGIEFDTINFGYFIPGQITIAYSFSSIWYETSSTVGCSFIISRNTFVFPMYTDDMLSTINVPYNGIAIPGKASTHATISLNLQLILSFTINGMHCNGKITSCKCTQADYSDKMLTLLSKSISVVCA